MPRRLATYLGATEDKRVGAELLHHLDTGRHALVAELERLGTKAEHKLAPPVRGVAVRLHPLAPERDGAVLETTSQRFIAGEPMKPATKLFAVTKHPALPARTSMQHDRE